MRAKQRGLTLLELVIVMVILVTFASLSFPIVFRSFSAQRLNKAADLVQAQLNSARVQAMRTGEIYGFFYFPNSRNFKVAPFEAEMVGVVNQARRNPDRISPSNYDYGDESLPQGVTFVEGEAIQDARSVAAEQETTIRMGDVRPILFYPDGSSQSARLYLKSNEDDMMEVQLRGMTGTSSTAPVNDRRAIGNRGGRR